MILGHLDIRVIDFLKAFENGTVFHTYYLSRWTQIKIFGHPNQECNLFVDLKVCRLENF